MKPQLKAKIGLMTVSLIMMSYMAPTAVLADIAQAFPAADPTLVQMIISMPSLLSIVVGLVVGRLTRWVYKRHLLLLAVLIMLIGGPLPFFASNSLGIILFSTALLGLGLGILGTCVPGLICDCFEGQERSFLIGIQAAFISGGSTVFTLLGGQLGRLGWRYCFLVYYLAVPMLAVAFFTLPKGRLEKPEPRPPGTKRAGWLTKPLVYFALVGFLFNVFVMVFSSNIAMLVEGRALGGANESSIVAMLFTLVGIPVGCLVHLVIRKFGKLVLPLTAVLGCVGMLLCLAGGQLWVLWLGAVFCGAAMQQFVPSGNLFSAEAASPENRSLSIATFQSFSNLGVAASPLIMGTLIPGPDVSMRFLVAAAGFALLSAVAAFARPREQAGVPPA
ncbi:MFS transporter [Ruminococcaceae bacterium OttesenSCG-928-D13]|nr:MFS transporter [Ruminococcaceae bacterium OttesenSCG-928-D13]